MKFLLITVLILIASCKEEQFNQQYNIPGPDKVETSKVEPAPKEEEDVLREFSIKTAIELPAYSKAIQTKFLFKEVSITCSLRYKASNYDRAIEKESVFKVTSDYLNVSSFMSKIEYLGYSIIFKKEKLNIEKLFCDIRNGEDLFLNKDMLETFKSIIERSDIFKEENFEVLY
jgi:hypothetical protein